MVEFPVKIPPVAETEPDVEAVVVTALLSLMKPRTSLTALTRSSAFFEMAVLSLATVSAAGVLVVAVAVIEMPGRTSVNVLVEEVMVCCAAVPAYRTAAASWAGFTTAAVGAANRSVAVPGRHVCGGALVRLEVASCPGGRGGQLQPVGTIAGRHLYTRSHRRPRR